MNETRAQRMTAVLRAAFSPQSLSVQDDSFRHAGHAGAQPGGETHFNVRIVAEAFHGVGRVERSRRVHDVLQRELEEGLHALSLVLRTPEEDDPS